MDLLIAIAALCNTPTGLRDIYHVHQMQTKCHIHYLKCYTGMEKSGEPEPKKYLYKCVLDNPHGLEKK